MLKRIAMVFGIVFILVALLGFMATGMSNMETDPALAPTIFGMFPVNVLHNVVHLVFGIWGVLAARSHAAASTFAKVGGAIYIVLAVLGYVSPTLFGFAPIGGNDIWLHGLLGVAMLGAGFAFKEDAVPAPV